MRLTKLSVRKFNRNPHISTNFNLARTSCHGSGMNLVFCPARVLIRRKRGQAFAWFQIWGKVGRMKLKKSLP
jgi:hypothetical protein